MGQRCRDGNMFKFPLLSVVRAVAFLTKVKTHYLTAARDLGGFRTIEACFFVVFMMLPRRFSLSMLIHGGVYCVCVCVLDRLVGRLAQVRLDRTERVREVDVFAVPRCQGGAHPRAHGHLPSRRGGTPDGAFGAQREKTVKLSTSSLSRFTEYFWQTRRLEK